jgi:hypothetical protein
MPKYVTLPSLLLKQLHSSLIGSLSDDPGSGLASVFVSVAIIEVLAVCSFHLGYLFFARSTVGEKSNGSEQAGHFQAIGSPLILLASTKAGGFIRTVSHRPDSGASPVDFKLHHYPAYIQLEKLPIGR